MSDSDDEKDYSDDEEKVMDDELKNFREKWKNELKLTKNNPKHFENNTNEARNNEQQAKKLFLQGTKMENLGKFHEAIFFYKRAVQLVPDIDNRIHIVDKNNTINDSNSVDVDAALENNDFNLLSIIKCGMSDATELCKPALPNNDKLHISMLPIEMIRTILKWVVSNELDFQSMENFGQVCRGFYLCARDQEIWRIACLKIWGRRCMTYIKNATYPTWRQMFIEHPRIHFNGLYIVKISYIRDGENSFQDTFYSPWHNVTYYRYLRFYPDGTVYFLTTPEVPVHIIAQFRHRKTMTQSPQILHGYYILTDDDRVLIRLEKYSSANNSICSDGGGGGNQNSRHSVEQLTQYNKMEFQIKSIAKRQKRYSQLVWLKYTMEWAKTNVEYCIFDGGNCSQFPPFWFSRVKSYTSTEATGPLS